MTPEEAAPFLIAIAVSFFFAGRAYERWSFRRYSRAAEIIKSKYQSHLSRTASPARTSKQ